MKDAEMVSTEEEELPWQRGGKSVPGGGNSRCKGPVAGRSR